jgi:hypothetical protein
MKRIQVLAMLIALAALVTLGGGVALADGGKGVTVQPLTPKPGDVITVKGDLLGPNSTVEVRIIGTGVDIDLGEVQADEEGDFTAQFRVPADLVPGTYQVQATGAESATTEITVVAAGPASSAEMPIDPAMMNVPVRERPLWETIALVALFGALSGLGLFFARTARREPAAR